MEQQASNQEEPATKEDIRSMKEDIRSLREAIHNLEERMSLLVGAEIANAKFELTDKSGDKIDRSQTRTIITIGTIMAVIGGIVGLIVQLSQ